jgi:hypothetical protein
MNMPARSGGAIHQIVGEHPSQSLEEFIRALETREFVIVEEFYKDAEAGKSANVYYSVGSVAINHRYVGKIKII